MSRRSKPCLLVLDTFRYQKLFEALLGNDYELLTTDQPGEALLMAASQNPDLILLAQNQEETNGLMVAREIRETAASIGPIFLSSLPTCPRSGAKRRRPDAMKCLLNPSGRKTEVFAQRLADGEDRLKVLSTSAPAALSGK